MTPSSSRKHRQSIVHYGLTMCVTSDALLLLENIILVNFGADRNQLGVDRTTVCDPVISHSLIPLN